MRWGSVDSIQFERKMPNPQDWNGYSYANRNPIRNIDPNGRDFLDMIKKCANYVSKGDYKKAVREVQRHLDIKAGWGATIGGLGVAEKNIGRREYSLPGLALGDKPKISVGYSAAVGYQATFETKDETRNVKELRENVIGQREVVTVGSYTETVPDNDKPMQEEMNFGPFTQNVSTGELTLSFSLSMFGYAEIE